MGSLGPLGRIAWRLAPRRSPPQHRLAHPGTVIGVYRNPHRARVEAMLAECDAEGWGRSLWQLDADGEPLEGTLGNGPGTRTTLLNKLATSAAPGPLLVVDDDVDFVESLSSLLAVVAALDLDLAQPAMTWDSQFSHPITACRPWLIARETTFVEVGPVLYVSERARDVVFPMDESYGMGWGLELLWHDAIVDGRLRAGIIDAAPVRHLGQVGGGYAKDREIALLQARLQARGLRSMRDIQSTTKRVWRRPASTP